MSKRLQALRTAVAAALAAVMLLCITHLSAADPDPAQNDEPKKEEVKKEEPKKDEKETTNEDLRKLAEQLRQEMESFRREMQRALSEARRGGLPAPPPVPRILRPPQGGRLGVSVDRPGEVLAEHLNLEKNTGLLITDVVDESPAAKAGLKSHDILVEFGGKPVSNSPVEFARMVEESKANTPIDAVVIRKGKREAIKGISLPEPRPLRRTVLPLPRQVVVLPMTFCR